MNAHIIKLTKQSFKYIYSDFIIVFVKYLSELGKIEIQDYELEVLIKKNKVIGAHDKEKIVQIKNIVDLIEYVLEVEGTPLSCFDLKIMDQILKKETVSDKNVLSEGTVFTDAKKIEKKKQEQLDKLLLTFSNRHLSLEEIVRFHIEFERIYHFSNESIQLGWIIILKQCVENQIIYPLLPPEKQNIYKKKLVERDELSLIELFKEGQDMFERTAIYNLFLNMESAFEKYQECK